MTRQNPGTAGVQVCHLTGSLPLACGKGLDGVRIAYETWGTLDEQASNAVLVCHALSGDSHVAGEEPALGWWSAMVGPGKPIDTDRFFVVCSNVLGGCSGSTGPGSLDPATGRPYGLRFPLVTVEDMVDAQAALLDTLGIRRLAAVVGGSLGGMQALAWARRYPERVASCVASATTWRLTAQAIAFNEVGRQAILGDPDFAHGDYGRTTPPALGLAIARMIGHITYLSADSMRSKFGRRLQERSEHAFDFVTEFEVESYLAHQGRKFVERFDANTYLYMSKAMDYFDLAQGASSLETSFAATSTRFLVLAFSSDWLFPTHQSRELVDALRRVGAEVSFAEIESSFGHDSFLLETEAQAQFVTPFLERTLERERQTAGGEPA